jgi:hypothetical protein
MTDTPKPGAETPPRDYDAAFATWWAQAVHPTMKPSAAAARTHVLFAQHMVLLELEAAANGASVAQEVA